VDSVSADDGGSSNAEVSGFSGDISTPPLPYAPIGRGSVGEVYKADLPFDGQGEWGLASAPSHLPHGGLGEELPATINGVDVGYGDPPRVAPAGGIEDRNSTDSGERTVDHSDEGEPEGDYDVEAEGDEANKEKEDSANEEEDFRAFSDYVSFPPNSTGGNPPYRDHQKRSRGGVGGGR